MMKLSPCRFCKSVHVEIMPQWCDSKLVRGMPGVDTFYVHCDNCGADGPPGDDVEEAIRKWNLPIRQSIVKHVIDIQPSIEEVIKHLRYSSDPMHSKAAVYLQELQNEGSKLSAGSCLHEIRGDEGGNAYCTRIQELENAIRENTNFETAWQEMQNNGYNYGEDALEGVKLGWEMHTNIMKKYL